VKLGETHHPATFVLGVPRFFVESVLSIANGPRMTVNEGVRNDKT